MSAATAASSIGPAKSRDRVRALQRVLYRSAKHQPERRFHALFDKVARSDVLWQAWLDVRANQGAPGVDGVGIEAIDASGDAGVRTFLEDLAAQLRAGTYRPQRLRRVNISKPGKPGQFRPLGIPTVRDRVAMAAAKIVLEPAPRRPHAQRIGALPGCACLAMKGVGEPCAGEPHARFDAAGGGVARPVG